LGSIPTDDTWVWRTGEKREEKKQKTIEKSE
jgi:hypothetical protein